MVPRRGERLDWKSTEAIGSVERSGQDERGKGERRERRRKETGSRKD
jgi:hypothetical protein